MFSISVSGYMVNLGPWLGVINNYYSDNKNVYIVFIVLWVKKSDDQIMQQKMKGWLQDVGIIDGAIEFGVDTTLDSGADRTNKTN